MKMIRQQTIGVQCVTKLQTVTLKVIQKSLIVTGFKKDRLPIVSPGKDVVKQAGSINSGRVSHGKIPLGIRLEGGNAKVKV